MRKAVSLALSLVLAGVAVFGLSVRAEAAESYKEKIEKFFGIIKEGKTSEAIDFIYSDNPWIQRSPDAVQNVKDQMMRLKNLVGDYKSHEELVEKTVAGRFTYISYFVAYERQPLRYVFEFYRPEDKWMIYSFAFDDTIDEEIEAAASLAENL